MAKKAKRPNTENRKPKTVKNEDVNPLDTLPVLDDVEGETTEYTDDSEEKTTEDTEITEEEEDSKNDLDDTIENDDEEELQQEIEYLTIRVPLAPFNPNAHSPGRVPSPRLSPEVGRGLQRLYNALHSSDTKLADGKTHVDSYPQALIWLLEQLVKEPE